MKKILILSVLVSLLAASCSNENIVSSNYDQKLEWLSINKDILGAETELTVYKTINGNTGGSILIDELVGRVKINGSLTIPAGSYPGNQNISITFNDYWFYQDYKPSPILFKTPLILNLYYYNVNLYTTSKIGFYYLSDSGQFITAEYDSLIIDPVNGTLGIIGAKLPHFSRWGWAKSTE